MIRLRSAAVAGLTALALTGLMAPAEAALPTSERGPVCAPQTAAGAAAKGDARAPGEVDHRDVSATEQRAIDDRTSALLARKGGGGKPLQGITVPVYVHVMAAADGTGDVTDAQVTQQVAVLNNTFAGGESSGAADTGFRFTLAGLDRFYNDTWHNDRSSSTYRKATRQGGADALNIWLVDFNYLGVATFPWDFDKKDGIDGIRVQYSSLPGGTEKNYNLGETATHEAGHWFGLFHTFQGGCNEPGDEISDTPAQSVATNGCPAGQDSCVDQPGLDPIHNYMDYSYDSCYWEFSPGQSVRMADMWTAYRS
ncbi:zinc metalloprotease [Nocardioides mesophilus]|uniref:Zinc metalloprotease n=1 Tax=Nocardioides mesophilus TaxID=433659 RepID=A0A7G9R9C5_9ACTN|nr:zinc metalloprotease [Nocardioides mesophilus]QNN52200.1 zinc metalloprotease [Nocardioides mesophilus]